MTLMFRPLSLRWATTQSMAAMTCDTSTAPSWAPTFTLTRLTSGATPLKEVVDVYDDGVPTTSRPAMIEARCVPWP